MSECGLSLAELGYLSGEPGRLKFLYLRVFRTGVVWRGVGRCQNISIWNRAKRVGRILKHIGPKEHASPLYFCAAVNHRVQCERLALPGCEATPHLFPPRPEVVVQQQDCRGADSSSACWQARNRPSQD